MTPPPQTVGFGGIRFDNVTLDQAVERVAGFIAAGIPRLVATPNLDHVVRFQRDPAFAAAVRRAALVLADGQPIVWATRWLGRPLCERVTGSDLFPALCARAAREGWRLFFLGGAPGVAQQARAVLESRHADLRIVGTHCPPYGFERDPAACRAALAAVQAARPDLLFVGLGSPKQERWIDEHLAACGATVAIGIGITFSFVTGHVTRAPHWMRSSGLEWLHRLAHEPRRLWRRYLIDSWPFLPLVWREWRAAARKAQPDRSLP